jgi:hypothetical protein
MRIGIPPLTFQQSKRTIAVGGEAFASLLNNVRVSFQERVPRFEIASDGKASFRLDKDRVNS